MYVRITVIFLAVADFISVAAGATLAGILLAAALVTGLSGMVGRFLPGRSDNHRSLPGAPDGNDSNSHDDPSDDRRLSSPDYPFDASYQPNVVTVGGDDVGCTVDLEHVTRHAGDHRQPRTLRCTQVYRRADGVWKVGAAEVESNVETGQYLGSVALMHHGGLDQSCPNVSPTLLTSDICRCWCPSGCEVRKERRHAHGRRLPLSDFRFLQDQDAAGKCH